LVWASSTTDITMLIASRFLGGAFSAMIFPGTLSTITNVIPSERRSQAVAAWTVSAAVGGTLGALGAGALIESFWFGSIFAGTAVLCLVIAVMTVLFVPETFDPEDSNLDPVGSLLSVIGIGALTFGIIEGPVKGWTSTETLGGFAAGVIFLAAFVGWELRTERPVLDVRLFKLRGFSTGSVSIFLQFFAAFGFFYVGAQFLAFVFGYSPLSIGLAFLPVGLSIPLGAAVATRLSSTVSRGVIGGVGLAVLAAGAAGFTFLSSESAYWTFAAALFVFGAGMGLAGPPATEAIVEALPAERQGVASAINDVARELGGALGIALIGSMLTAGYRSGIDEAAGLPAGLDDVIREAPGVGLGVATQAGPEGAGIVDVVQSAVTDGFGLAMWVAAGAAIAGAVYVALRTPPTGAEASALDASTTTVTPEAT
jgi:EmrB/QacA subfamily drug resistance transporter